MTQQAIVCHREVHKERTHMQPQCGWIRKVIFLGLIFGGFMLPSVVAAQPTASSSGVAPLTPGVFRLTVTGTDLSLEANEASVVAIFQEIGRQTGIPMAIDLGVDETVTTKFARIPLADALKRIAKNVAVVTSPGSHVSPHRIAKVYVFATGQSGSPQVGRTHTPSTAEATPKATRPEPFRFTFDPSQHMK
jgi:hypothetical protein